MSSRIYIAYCQGAKYYEQSTIENNSIEILVPADEYSFQIETRGRESTKTCKTHLNSK